MTLWPWQKELYDFILVNKDNPIISERRIIWIEDNRGCTLFYKVRLRKNFYLTNNNMLLTNRAL